MPANEQTWYDPKLMHRIFGATSVLMLIATIWMFVADHSREWKPIQHAANRLEMTMTDWRRLQFQTDELRGEETKLQARLDTARQAPITDATLQAFKRQVLSDPETSDYSFETMERRQAELQGAAGTPEAAELRDEVIEEMREIVARARHREDIVLGERKFKSADRDAAVAELGLMVRDGRSAEDQAGKQRQIDQLTSELTAYSAQYEHAKEHRTTLEEILRRITGEEDEAKEALDEHRAEMVQLDTANEERRSTYFVWNGYLPLPGKKFLELPIFDAFNSPRKIDNLWSDGLEIFYNFRYVRRFDRCTTCHQLLPKSMPGSAIDPAYVHETLVDFRLEPTSGEKSAAAAAGSDPATSAVAAADPANPADKSVAQQVKEILGLQIAPEGLLASNDATIQFIVPESVAAKARPAAQEGTRNGKVSGEVLQRGLLMPDNAATAGLPVQPGLAVGDVIVAINDNPVMHASKAAGWLLDEAASGKPFVITVRRGMPNPYTTHPRLDLFVGSLSPHKMSEFACTICHEGQGSATSFQWASHTPNSVRERKDWSFEHGWFDNPHWIYPMYPKRFAESSCLKCHHDVVELEPSERFPQPPAPKVVQGYHLIRKYGCYGCHEVNGYDGKKRIGPDLRLEPNVFAAAQQLMADPGFDKLPEEVRDWVDQLIDHPDRTSVRHRLLEVLEREVTAEAPRLGEDTLDKLTPLFRDIESPGTLRKAGPSLRFAGHKLTSDFMYDWIREPKGFRPSTRMPQFFEQYRHLEGSPGLHDALKLEPLEILSMVTYLRDRTQKFDYLEIPEEVTEAANKDRGRVLFQTRGCLACHNHSTFADAQKYRAEDEIVQGPDLSGIGDKFTSDEGRKWLYSWIKEPSRYHARTVMPDLFLDPIRGAEDKVTDPAADIVEFLLSESKRGWQPNKEKLLTSDKVSTDVLNDFVITNLAEAFARHRAEQYAQKGVPASMRSELKGAEVELIVSDEQYADPGFKLTTDQKLLYLGRRTIAKYGCYGCHDVPGFEDAKPIGTGLADWGRKDSARLAFEHISHYLEHGHGHGAAGDGHGAHSGERGDPAATPTADTSHSEPVATVHAQETKWSEDALAEASPYASEADREYYEGQLKAGHRAGFIYQKLLEPRSFDYHKTENKRYNERLRMPQFPFSSAEREAVITFVLGLVAEPPAAKFVYRATEERKAILAGKQVIEKYNCGGCHVLSAEKWQIAFPRGKYGEQTPVKTFPFIPAHFAPQELQSSAKVDRSGLTRATLIGMPAVDDTGTPIAYDDVGDPLIPEENYDPHKLDLPFELWQPTAIDGNPYNVGVMPLTVSSAQIESRSLTNGGFLAKYLLPHVVALEKQVNPAAKGSEAWGWLPPPLIGEGSKVQSDWLHEFLLNPYPIRPATFLRMPKFNMSPLEATQIVNYFAAIDGAEYPYAYNSRQQREHLRSEDSEYQRAINGAEFDGRPRNRFDDAMRVVVNNNYCVKCHLVGDFEPAGSDRAKAPNLALVHRRLRPEYARHWIANPKSILPYTSMPVNVIYDPELPNMGGVSQELYHGTSVEQVDALVDLLMNFDEYTKQRTSIATLVKEYGGPAAPADATTPAPAAPAATGTTGEGNTGGGNTGEN